MKVLICGDAPLESEANASIRGSIHDGWVQYLSERNVISASLTGAASVIAQWRPHLVLGVGSYLPETAYFGEATAAARRVGAVSAFWATEDPYEKDASYRIENAFDAVFTCDRWGLNFYDHKRAFHLPLAGCVQRHFIEIDAEASRPIDILFCGVAFANRKEIIETLKPAFAGYTISIIGPGWGEYGPGFTDRRVDKAELIALYGRAKLVLNLGRSLSFENSRYMIAPSTPGPRTFEAAMAGAAQIFHEDTAELRHYFTEDEVPSFSSRRDFTRLCDRLLGDHAERIALARRAQNRAVNDHTYALRAEQIVSVLRDEALL